MDYFNPCSARFHSLSKFHHLGLVEKVASLAAAILAGCLGGFSSVAIFRLIVKKFYAKYEKNQESYKQIQRIYHETCQRTLNINENNLTPLTNPHSSEKKIIPQQPGVNNPCLKSHGTEKGIGTQKILLSHDFELQKINSIAKQLNTKPIGTYAILESPGKAYLLYKNMSGDVVTKIFYNQIIQAKKLGDFICLAGSPLDLNMNKTLFYKHISEIKCSILLKQYYYDDYYSGQNVRTEIPWIEILNWLKNSPAQKNNVFFKECFFKFIARFFSHVYDLEGTFQIGKSKVKLGGMKPLLALGSLLHFQKEHFTHSNLSQEIKHELEQLLKKSLLYTDYSELRVEDLCLAIEKQMLTDLQNGQIISFGSGWYRHSVNVTMSSKFIIYSNQGRRKKENPAGAIIFPIKGPITIGLIRALKRSKKNDENSFLLEQRGAQLKQFGLGEPIYTEIMPDQTACNCAVKSNRLNYWAFHFLKQLMNTHNCAESAQYANTLQKNMDVSVKEQMLKLWLEIQPLALELGLVSQHSEIYDQMIARSLAE